MIRGSFAALARGIIAGLIAALAVTGVASAQDAYRLGEGDLVRLTVYQRPDLSVESRLGGGGKLYVPGGGNLEVGGMTLAQAEQQVATLLSRSGAASNPQVDLQVVEFGSQKVSVFGYVGQPGSYVLDRPTRLSELLAQAGGVVPEGSDTIYLLRRGGQTVNRTVVNLRDIIEDGNANADPSVRGGDIVTVPRAPMVYVYGSVNRPGAYKLDRGMTALQMIALAGGLSPTGSDNRLEVVRRGAQGAQSLKVGLQDPLQAEDVLIVRESIF